MARIVYIGNKEVKGDNVAQTGLTWTKGQVHEVSDEKKVAKLLEHTLIWRDATNKSDAEIAALLLPPLKAVQPEPKVSLIPEVAASPYWEPVVIPVPAEIFEKVQKKELVAVFMTSEDADAFGDWKLERDTRPVDTAPKNTGPKAQGLEKKKVA